jgi:Flp pilus assembly protein TadG
MTHTARAGARLGGDDGAVMVEAALLTPIFVFLLFGTLEFGGLFRDYLTINDATASGARGAAIAGNDANADYQILQGVKSSSEALSKTGIKKIIVYKATNSSTPVPANCKALTPTGTSAVGISGGSNPCNVYAGSNLNSPESPGFVDCSVTSLQSNWCPASRKYAAKSTNGNGPPDFLGVYIEFEHKFWTGMFGNSFTITSTTVTRLEPSTLL